MTKLLTVIICLTFVACGQAQNSNATTNGTNPKWKTLDTPDYSIQYPPDWELNQGGLMGIAFILFSPVESIQDQFKENVNLLIQDLSGHNIDLDKYAEISEGQIKLMITNSTLIESKRINTGSEQYHRMVFTGDQGIYHLKFEQHYWIKNNKAYVLTLTCEQAKFADYKEVGEKVLTSFTFKK
jgi:hypothetical protein